MKYARRERKAEKLTKPIMIIGTATDSPDIEYATGFRAVDPVIFLRRGDERFLVVPQLEYGRAAKASRRVEVFCPETLNVAGEKKRKFGEWALAVLKKLGIRSIQVPGAFPYGVAMRLRKAGIRITIAEGELFPERAVKSAEEVRKITDSQQAAVIAMRAAISAIAAADIDAAGYLKVKDRRLTSEDIRRLITRILYEHDCSSREIIVASGEQAADPHEVGSGPLRAHEPIVMDIFPHHLAHGYWGDLTRTVVRGSASPDLRRMYQAVRAAQHEALNCVKPGVKCARVHGAAVDEFKNRGFYTGIVDGKPEGFIHSVGHGVGLAIHEAPGVGSTDRKLKAGNVITIEPGLYYPGRGGIRIEDTVVVTATGWRYLVPCEKRFEV